MLNGTWERKEGMLEYSIKRLPGEARLDAIERLKEIPISEDLKHFMKI